MKNTIISFILCIIAAALLIFGVFNMFTVIPFTGYYPNELSIVISVFSFLFFAATMAEKDNYPIETKVEKEPQPVFYTPVYKDNERWIEIDGTNINIRFRVCLNNATEYEKDLYKDLVSIANTYVNASEIEYDKEDEMTNKMSPLGDLQAPSDLEGFIFSPGEVDEIVYPDYNEVPSMSFEDVEDIVFPESGNTSNISFEDVDDIEF